jgi:hypothetical protein
MPRHAAVFFAVLLVIGPSADASSHGGDYGGRDGSASFCDNNPSGCFRGCTSRDDYGGYDNNAGGLRNRFRRCGARDVWGHWGTYYGPMI